MTLLLRNAFQIASHQKADAHPHNHFGTTALKYASNALMIVPNSIISLSSAIGALNPQFGI